MYVYRLINFELLQRTHSLKFLMFSEKGMYIYRLSHKPGKCKSVDGFLEYFNPKKQEECSWNGIIDEIRDIDFIKLPESIQGLFILYNNKNTTEIPYEIKKSLGYYQWKKLLTNYSQDTALKG